MPPKPVELAIRQIISDFTKKMVTLAVAHAHASLAHFLTSPAGGVPAGDMPAGRPLRASPPVEGPVHAPEHVDRLIELVRAHPWPPQSRELQKLLGVKKDPFLRIVTLALDSGRLTRTGKKAGIRYHLSDGKPPRRRGR